MNLYFLTSRIRLKCLNLIGLGAIIICNLLLSLSCVKRPDIQKVEDNSKSVDSALEITNREANTVLVDSNVASDKKQPPTKYKAIAQALRYMSGIEGEVLKLLLGEHAPTTNPFEVLVKGLSIYTGTSGEYLSGFDCQKIVLKELSHKIEFFSDCQKPARKIAELTVYLTSDKKFAILFLIPEWNAIVGPVAKLGLENRFCEFEIKDERLYFASCQNTIYANWTQQNSINYYDLRLKKYIFKRDASDELVVEGGQYKDMIEIKKISLKVPVAGKIEIHEKELKVKDDFAEMQNNQMLNLKKTKGEPDNEEKNQSPDQENINEENNSEKSSEKSSEKTESGGYSR